MREAWSARSAAVRQDLEHQLSLAAPSIGPQCRSLVLKIIHMTEREHSSQVGKFSRPSRKFRAPRSPPRDLSAEVREAVCERPRQVTDPLNIYVKVDHMEN